MENKDNNNISNLENDNSVINNLENNIEQIQKKSSKLYLFLFLIDKEVGNSVVVKAFHELNEENQENNILLNRNNSIRIELCQLQISKEMDTIIKSIEGIIFINNFQKNQKKLDNNVELIKKIEKKFKKVIQKNFFLNYLLEIELN